MTKIFWGNQYVTKFNCDGRKRTKFQRFVLYVKYYLIQSAKVCIALWILVGVFHAGAKFIPQTPVYAEREVVKEVAIKSPVLDRIAKCESGNMHMKDGQVILNANNNGSVDAGVFQINVKIWGKVAASQGLNLMIEKDNREFANYLYRHFGTEPWIWSKSCWNK